MSDHVARIAAMAAVAKAKESAKREQVRQAMPDDMAEFLDEWKAFDSEAKLTFLDTPSLKLGKEGDRGIGIRDMVIGPLAITAQAGRASKGR